jgi:hypothetical protein
VALAFLGKPLPALACHERLAAPLVCLPAADALDVGGAVSLLVAALARVTGIGLCHGLRFTHLSGGTIADKCPDADALWLAGKRLGQMLRYQIGQLTEGSSFVMVRLFDDGLVLSAPVGAVPGSNVAAGAALGAIGGAISGAVKGAQQAKESVRQQALVRAEAAGHASARDLAAALGSYAQLIPLAQVTSVRLEKGFGLSRKLVLQLADGTTRRFRFGDKAHPSAEVAVAYGAVLGDRFTNTLRNS